MNRPLNTNRRYIPEPTEGNTSSGKNEYRDRVDNAAIDSDRYLQRLRASIQTHAFRANMNPTRAQLLLVNGVMPERGL